MLRYSLSTASVLMCLTAQTAAPAAPAAKHLAPMPVTSLKPTHHAKPLAVKPAPAAKEDYGFNSLMWAAYAGRVPEIKKLLASGVDTEAKDNYSRTALMIAAERGQVGAINALIAGGADVNSKGNSGYTALLFAAKASKTAAVKALIAAHANVNVRGNNGQTALSLGAGNPNIVAALTAAGATSGGAVDTASATYIAPNYPETMLMKAARAGDMERVKALIAAHANVNTPSGDGQTVLSWAAAAGNADLVKVLLDAGAFIDQPVRIYTSFWTPWDSTTVTPGETFTGTARHGNSISITVTQPTPGGPIMAYEEGVMDQTPLIIAAEHGHADIVKMLLDAGAKTTSNNVMFVGSLSPTGGGGSIPAIVRSSESALTAAMSNHHQDVVDLLSPPANPPATAPTDVPAATPPAASSDTTSGTAAQ